MRILDEMRINLAKDNSNHFILGYENLPYSQCSSNHRMSFLMENVFHHFKPATSVIWPSRADLYTKPCLGQMRFRQRLDLANRIPKLKQRL